MTTVLLNLHNAGAFEVTSGILALGTAAGGFTQLVAGILEYHRGNLLAMTAFMSYGMFWLSLVGGWFLPVINLGTPADGTSMAFFMFVWFCFSFVMFVGALKISRALSAILGLLTLLFLILTLEKFLEVEPLQRVAGGVGILCGALSFYLGYAELFNFAYKKEIFPTFPVKSE